jgi:hypothetical protein
MMMEALHKKTRGKSDGLDPKDGANASGLHGSIHQTSDVFKLLGSWAMTVRQC